MRQGGCGRGGTRQVVVHNITERLNVLIIRGCNLPKVIPRASEYQRQHDITMIIRLSVDDDAIARPDTYYASYEALHNSYY